MVKNRFSSHQVGIEPLESRTLFAASTTGPYDLASLLCYNKLGAAWTYSTSVSTDSSLSASQTVSAPVKMAVAAKKQTYNGVACNVVKAISKEMSLTEAWYSNTKGTFMAMMARSTNGMSLNINLSNSMVAPKSMYVGKVYTYAGTFSGTFSLSMQGQTYSGTIKGTDSLTSRLFGTQSIRVPAGRFSAMKGAYGVTLNGTVTVRVEGQNYAAKVSASQASTFWAAPNVGTVSSQDVAYIKVAAEGENAWASLTGTSNLKAYTVP